MRTIPLLLAAALAAPGLQAAEPEPVKPDAAAHPVDAIVRAEMQRRKIPGVAVAVVRNGKTEYSRAYGHADLELNVSARTDHLFEIGSVTKQFTAVAVMLLVEEGKVRLDAPATDYLKTDWPEAWKGVTVRHLLNHTGGIPNFTAQPDFSWTTVYTPETVMALVKDKPLEFTPGERMAYSNTGYYLLGRLIASASGKPYGEFLTERVLRPAGMSHTRLSEREVIPNRAHGYIVQGDTVLNAPMVLNEPAGAAGAILSSVEDMAKWEAALAARRLLKPASYEQIWAPARLNGGEESPYALGWVVAQQKGHRVMSHAGGTAGFSSVVTRVEPENLTVIVLCNTGAGAAERIAMGMVSHYIPDLKPDPPAAPPDKDPDPARTERTKSIALNLLSENPDFTPLTEDMKKALTPEMLKGIRAQMLMIGPLKSFVYLGDTETPQGRVFRYRATFGELPLVVTATYDKDEKIAGLYMQPE